MKHSVFTLNDSYDLSGWFFFPFFFSSPPVSNAFPLWLLLLLLLSNASALYPVTLAYLTIRFGNVHIHEMLSLQRAKKPTIHLLTWRCGDLLVRISRKDEINMNQEKLKIIIFMPEISSEKIEQYTFGKHNTFGSIDTNYTIADCISCLSQLSLYFCKQQTKTII